MLTGCFAKDFSLFAHYFSRPSAAIAHSLLDCPFASHASARPPRMGVRSSGRAHFLSPFFAIVLFSSSRSQSSPPHPHTPRPCAASTAPVSVLVSVPPLPRAARFTLEFGLSLFCVVRYDEYHRRWSCPLSLSLSLSCALHPALALHPPPRLFSRIRAPL